MLMEQEFELCGPGHPGRTCTPTTGNFYDKTKFRRNIFEWIVLFSFKILQEAMYLTFPYLGQITYKFGLKL